jgi:peroxiredoxin
MHAERNLTMKTNTIFHILLTLFLTLTLSGCSTSVPSPSPTPNPAPSPSARTEVVKQTNDGRPAFNFNLADLNGKQHTLADYRGKKVYIEYWASWCPICLNGLADFATLAKAYEKSDAVVVISMVPAGANGEKTAVEFIRWFKERGYAFPVLLDDGGIVARQFNVRAFPTSILIGSDGVLISATPGQQSNASILAKIAAIK